MTRLVFFWFRGDKPISTTFTSGVNPIRLLTLEAIRFAEIQEVYGFIYEHRYAWYLFLRMEIRIWYSLDTSGNSFRISSICREYVDTFNLHQSSFRPMMVSRRGNLLPQGQSPGIIRERSWVR